MLSKKTCIRFEDDLLVSKPSYGSRQPSISSKTNHLYSLVHLFTIGEGCLYKSAVKILMQGSEFVVTWNKNHLSTWHNSQIQKTLTNISRYTELIKHCVTFVIIFMVHIIISDILMRSANPAAKDLIHSMRRFLLLLLSSSERSYS